MTPNCRSVSTVSSSMGIRRHGTKGRLVVFALACALGGGGGIALADPISVCSSGCDATTIEDGIALADANGDIVEVWDGTYNEHDLDLGAFAITVRSKDGADNCIVDCGGSGRGFFIDTNAILEGLTIRDGDAGSAEGGGVKCSEASPTIRDCVIEYCFAGAGGGIAALGGAAVTIENCTIQECWAGSAGGGVYVASSTAAVSGSLIADNGRRESYDDTSGGGGVAVDSGELTLENCVIQANHAFNGGGLEAIKDITLTATDVVIEANQASVSSGGGAYVSGDGTSQETFVRCRIVGNSCTGGGGGGILAGQMGGGANTVSFTNCLIAGNQHISYGFDVAGGGGVLLSNGVVASFVNCTIAGNETDLSNGGGGIAGASGTVPVKNCIIWGNQADGSLNQLAGSGYTLTWTDIQGGWGGSGSDNIDSDPLFADAPSGDYRLFRGSPCIDNGKSCDCTDDCDDGDLVVAARKVDHVCTDDTGDDCNNEDLIDMGCYEAFGGLIYVDKDATGGNDGSSWANAYTDLQNAFSEAGDDAFEGYDPAACEVWVAEGSYKTSPCTNCSDTDKQKSFALVDGVGVYGRFSGTETARSQRGLMAINETILTGLLGGVSPANAYHVVTAAGGVTSTAVLDGFTVKKGKANGSTGDLDKGGGFLIEGSPHLEGVSIKENYAKNGGGAS